MNASEKEKDKNNTVDQMIELLKNIPNQKMTLKDIINEYYNNITIQMLSDCNKQLKEKYEETITNINEIKSSIDQ